MFAWEIACSNTFELHNKQKLPALQPLQLTSITYCEFCADHLFSSVCLPKMVGDFASAYSHGIHHDHSQITLVIRILDVSYWTYSNHKLRFIYFCGTHKIVDLTWLCGDVDLFALACFSCSCEVYKH